MHQHGGRPRFLKGRYGGRHDTNFGAWKKYLVVLDRNVASFPFSSKLELDTLITSSLDGREYVAR